MGDDSRKTIRTTVKERGSHVADMRKESLFKSDKKDDKDKKAKFDRNLKGSTMFEFSLFCISGQPVSFRVILHKWEIV